MTPGTDARHWQETAQHLVQAHGALPGALISYAPTLEQLGFAHADTHEALASGTRRPHPYRAIAPRVSLRPGLLVPPVPARTDSELPHRWGAVLRLGDVPAADAVGDMRPPGLSGGRRGIPQ